MIKKFILAAALILAPLQAQAQSDVILVLDTSAGVSFAFDDVAHYITGPFLREFLRFGDTFHLITFSDAPALCVSRRVDGPGDLETIIARMLLHPPVARNSSLAAALDFIETFAQGLPAARPAEIVLVSSASGQGAQLQAAAERLSLTGAAFHFVEAGGRGPLADLPVSSRARAVAAAGIQPDEPLAEPPPAEPQIAQAGEPPAGDLAGGTAQAAPLAELPPLAEPPPAEMPPSEPQIAQAAGEPPAGDLAGGTARAAPVAELPPAEPPPSEPQIAQAAGEPPAGDPSGGGLHFNIFWIIGAGLAAAVFATLLFFAFFMKRITIESADLSPPVNNGQAAFSFPVKKQKAVFTPPLKKPESVFRLPEREGGAQKAQAVQEGLSARRRAGIAKYVPAAASRSRSAGAVGFETKDTATLKLFVEGQNTAIGKRNTHSLKQGVSFTVGGPGSDFLIFLVSLPKAIGEIRKEGGGFKFIPNRLQFFPDIDSGGLNDCVNKTIRIAAGQNREVRIKFVPSENPHEKLAVMLDSLKAPV